MEAESRKECFGVLQPPAGRTDEIQHEEPELRLTSREIRGDRQIVVPWKCRTDGSACSVSVHRADLKIGTTAAWNGLALVLESRGEYGGRQFRTTDHWRLSADGKTLTIARRMGDDSGETHQNLVFDR